MNSDVITQAAAAVLSLIALVGGAPYLVNLLKNRLDLSRQGNFVLSVGFSVVLSVLSLLAAGELAPEMVDEPGEIVTAFGLIVLGAQTAYSGLYKKKTPSDEPGA